MLNSREQQLQVLGLLVAALFVFVTRQVWEHDGATNAISAIATNCEFAKPGLYNPYIKSSSHKWCEGSGDLRGLMNHMRVYCRKMDACIGAEFGSYVMVGYVPSLDMFLINPTIHAPEPGAEMIECVTGTDGAEQIVRRHSPVTVTFQDEQLRTSKREFFHRGACLVHFMEFSMRGKSTPF